MAKQVFRIFKAAAVGTTAATLADKLTPAAVLATPTAPRVASGEAPPPPTLDALAEAIRRARGGK